MPTPHNEELRRSFAGMRCRGESDIEAKLAAMNGLGTIFLVAGVIGIGACNGAPTEPPGVSESGVTPITPARAGHVAVSRVQYAGSRSPHPADCGTAHCVVGIVTNTGAEPIVGIQQVVARFYTSGGQLMAERPALSGGRPVRVRRPTIALVPEFFDLAPELASQRTVRRHPGKQGVDEAVAAGPWVSARSSGGRSPHVKPLRSGAEGGSHGHGEPFPACRLFFQPPPAGVGQPVVLGSAPGFALAPFRLDEPLVLESVERRVD